jgi:hypothetical protein
MAERLVSPANQRHFIEPFDQRVFQFDTDKSDVFLSRVANSVYKIFGDDIVMYGMEIPNIANTTESVVVDIEPGICLQDNTLLITPDVTQLELNNVSGMDQNGRIVALCNYNFLQTFEQNKHSFQLNYIDQSGNPLHPFMEARDRLVLGIFTFTKDGSDNVLTFEHSTQKSIIIDDKLYYLRGRSPDNRVLTDYLNHQLTTDGQLTSIELDKDDGIKLIGDTGTPGPSKYYGTDHTSVKGFYDLSTLAFDNESDLPEFQKPYNLVFYNGNLFIAEEGVSVADSLTPKWRDFTGSNFWDGQNGMTWNGATNFWDVGQPGAYLYVNQTGQIWYENYRPTHVMFEDIIGTGSIIVKDMSDNVLGENINCFSGAIIPLDFSIGLDIAKIEIFGGITAFRGVVFYAGTPGTRVIS